MANARKLDKRRKSVKNIRKITRTMELIATARFKKAMDRATAATAYTKRITDLVGSLSRTGLEVSHPLLEERDEVKNGVLLVLSGNRGLCGGYNGNVIRAGVLRWEELKGSVPNMQIEISGKRGIAAFKHRGITGSTTYTHFDDKPSFEEVDALATRYLEAYAAGEIDRLDVVYTKFLTISRQSAKVETLLPLGSLDVETEETAASSTEQMYEFMPSAASILTEVIPTSFKVKLFKCFLDAAVSEQVARMVAMKGATENAGDLIKQLSMTYNRARQSQITGEIMEIIGGVEALNK